MTVGRYLRARREERGEALDRVAEMLRIRRAYLQAIEADEIDRLPGPTYAVGFVRAYAEHLELDGASVVERFKEETEGLETRTQLVFPSPLPEGRVPSGAILMLAVIFLAAAYGGWMYLSSVDASLAELVPSLPDRFAALVGGDKPAAPDAANPVAAPGSTAHPPADGAPADGPAAERPAETPSGDTAPPTATPPMAAPEESRPGPGDGSAVTSAPAPVVSFSPSEPPPAGPAGNNAAPASGIGNAVAAPATESAPAPAASAPAVAETGSVPAATSAASAGGDAPAREAPAPASPAVETPAVEAAAPTAAAAATPAVAKTALAPTALATTAPASYPPDPPLPAFRETPKVFGTENEGSRIVILAVGDSWVEVRDRSGALLLTRVLRAGDRYRVPNQKGLTLVTGNAGGLEISVDGATVPSIGPVGTVRRNVPLDPDALKGGTAHLN